MLKFLLKSLLLLSVAAHAQTNETPDQSALAEMMNLEYADEARCTIKDNDGVVLAVVPLLVSAHTLEGSDQAMVIKALDESLKVRKCDIHAPDRAGLSALNGAILFNDATMVRYLLEQGADPKRLIEREKSPIHGKNSFEFLVFLQTIDKEKKHDRQAVEQVLQEYH